MFIANQLVDVRLNGSSALAKIGRTWIVVRQSNKWPGRVYVNEVGGDGHRVTPTGYRKIDAKEGFLPVGTQFRAVKNNPCGQSDSATIQLLSVPGTYGSTGSIPTYAAPVAPKPVRVASYYEGDGSLVEVFRTKKA